MIRSLSLDPERYVFIVFQRYQEVLQPEYSSGIWTDVFANLRGMLRLLDEIIAVSEKNHNKK